MERWTVGLLGNPLGDHKTSRHMRLHDGPVFSVYSNIMLWGHNGPGPDNSGSATGVSVSLACGDSCLCGPGDNHSGDAQSMDRASAAATHPFVAADWLAAASERSGHGPIGDGPMGSPTAAFGSALGPFFRHPRGQFLGPCPPWSRAEKLRSNSQDYT